MEWMLDDTYIVLPRDVGIKIGARVEITSLPNDQKHHLKNDIGKQGVVSGEPTDFGGREFVFVLMDGETDKALACSFLTKRLRIV